MAKMFRRGPQRNQIREEESVPLARPAVCANRIQALGVPISFFGTPARRHDATCHPAACGRTQIGISVSFIVAGPDMQFGAIIGHGLGSRHHVWHSCFTNANAPAAIRQIYRGIASMDCCSGGGSIPSVLSAVGFKV